jgi:hypothetical protein
MKNARKWLVGVGGLFLAVVTLYNGCQVTYVAEKVAGAEAKGRQAGHDAVQDVEIASVKGWTTAHDIRTGPMIDRFLGVVEPAVARIPAIEATANETAGLVREMHTFLVERYAMPTSLPLPPPYQGPIITARPSPSPSGGAIAGER